MMDPLALQAGDFFEDFRILRSLGKGGMGAVYLVQHPRLGSDVALKVMILHAATVEGLDVERHRFRREAQTLAKLRHNNIIRVLDFAEHESKSNDDDDEPTIVPFIVMEFFDGVDGPTWLKKKQPSLEQVRNVAIQLADALAYSHKAGVLHRDLKSTNFLVNERDEAILIDFGIAKSHDAEQVTQTGMSIGTLSHLAPEYFTEVVHTELTDLWGFGCLLYFLTTYQYPFSTGGGSDHRLMLNIMQTPHPPAQLIRTDASDAWSALLDDLLEKKPSKRIQSATELAARLRALPSATNPSAPPFVPPTKTRGAVQRTPIVQPPTLSSGGASSGVFASKPKVPTPSPTPTPKVPSGSLANKSTADGSPKPLDSEDDPFAGARHGDVPASLPSLSLPPLDGVTGIQTVAPLQRPVLAPAAASPAAKPAIPDPVPAAAAMPAPAMEPMGTFIAALQPQAYTAGPSPVPAAPPPVEDVHPEHQTPRTGAFALSAGAAPAPGLSVVQPLPAFAPAAPPAKPQGAGLRAVALPLLAVGGLAAVGFLGLSALDRKKPQPTPAQVAAVEEDAAMKKAEERGNRELEEAERLKQRRLDDAAQRANQPPPVQVAQAPAVEPVAAPAPTQPGPSRYGNRRGESSVPNGAPAPAAPAAEVDPITARYGNRSFNTGAFGAAQPTTAPAASAAAAPTAGVKIPVMVNGEIASSSSPVIATVTKETRVGAVTLPSGTQIHGVSSQGVGVRVAVVFKFAIVAGKNVPLNGIALGPDGRAGLPGQRTMGNGSDVAARALNNAGNAAVGMVAELAGDNPAGAGLRGAGNAAASKADRLNSDENVVVVKPGARFTVYVGG